MTQTSRGYIAVSLAPGALFAIALGTRQSQPFFIGPLNSQAGIG